jgi:hypothetical protein
MGFPPDGSGFDGTIYPGHESLGGETPARVARVRVGFRNWTDIVRLGT